MNSYKIVRGYVDNDGIFNETEILGPEYDAAPELLKALKVVTELLASISSQDTRFNNPRMIQARAAIAKAEGK